jgi:hypothetical protein
MIQQNAKMHEIQGQTTGIVPLRKKYMFLF